MKSRYWAKYKGSQIKIMLKYKVLKQTSRVGKLAGQEVQVAQQVLTGQVSFRQLCERLAKDTTVGQADIRAVLYQLADVVAEYMDLGMSVDCGELGKFRPTYGSRQVPMDEKFRAQDLKSPKITFVPRDKFKQFKYRAQFERVHDSATCSAGASAGSGDSSSSSSGKTDPNDPDYIGGNKPNGHTGL